MTHNQVMAQNMAPPQITVQITVQITRLFFIAAFLCLLWQTGTPARAGQTYTLMTGGPTSNFYPVGVALNTLLQLKYEEPQGVLLNVQQSEGARGNLLALLQGKADIAFVDSATILAAINKQPPFDQFNNIGEITALAALWPDVAHLILRRSQIQSGDADDFRNLIDDVVSFGPQNSTSAFASRQIFREIGVTYETLFQIQNYDIQQSADAFIDERINGLSFFTYPGSQPITRIMEAPKTNAAFLDINLAQLKRINSDPLKIWERYVIPAHTYANQPNPVSTIAQMNYLVAMKNFSENDAHYISQTLFENLTFVKALHGVAKGIDPETSKGEIILPLHLGVQRYLAEANPCTGIFCLFN